jgi:hypothetical protein
VGFGLNKLALGWPFLQQLEFALSIIILLALLTELCGGAGTKEPRLTTLLRVTADRSSESLALNVACEYCEVLGLAVLSALDQEDITI